MRFRPVAGWVLGIIALMFWVQIVIGVALFAIPDRYPAPESLALSALMLAVGAAVPGVIIWLLWMQGIVGARRAGGVERLSAAAAPADADPGATAADRSSFEDVTADDSARPDAGRPDADALLEPLTEREIEILQQVAAGKSNKEIAQDLVISTGTVKTHTNNLYRKLQARNRTDAVAIARRRGVL